MEKRIDLKTAPTVVAKEIGISIVNWTRRRKRFLGTVVELCGIKCRKCYQEK